MRNLVTGDCFRFLQLLRIAGLKEELAEIIDDVMVARKKNPPPDIKAVKTADGTLEDSGDAEVIGRRIFGFVLDMLGNERVEPYIYKFFAGIAEIEPKEIELQPIDKTFELIKDIIRENDIFAFFTQAVNTLEV